MLLLKFHPQLSYLCPYVTAVKVYRLTISAETDVGVAKGEVYHVIVFLCLIEKAAYQ